MSELISTNALQGYNVHATDGEIGQVVDIFLTDSKWDVLFFVVDARSWLPGKKLLIQPGLVREARVAERALGVSFTRAQVAEGLYSSPSQQEAILRLSRKKSSTNWAVYQDAVDSPADDTVIPVATSRRRETFNDHLRSVHIAGSLALHAQHQPVGIISDFLVDGKTWAIRYLTARLSGGEDIRLPPQHVGSIVLDENIVNVYLSPAAISSFVANESTKSHLADGRMA